MHRKTTAKLSKPLCFGLALFLMFFISSCGFQETKEQQTFLVGSICLEPEGEPAPGDVLIVRKRVNLSVAAEGAERVEFYAAPLQGQGPGIRFGVDENPDDGWQAFWEVPKADSVFRITAVAHRADRKTSSNSVNVKWAPERVVVDLSNTESRYIRQIEGLPKYFTAEGWLDDERVFGRTGTNLLHVNLRSGGYRSLGVQAWNARLSPDGKLAAYDNEEGLCLVKADGTGKQLLLPRDPAFGGEYIWSPEGRRLLVTYQHEIDAEFFVYNIETKETKPVNTKFENYSLNRVVGWPEDHLLVFNTVSHKKKDGTVEYTESGYRWDLALYDLSTDECSLITSADEGEFIVGIAAGKNGILFERRYQGKDSVTRGLIDFAGRVVWEEDLGDVVCATMSPDGNNLAYVVIEKEDRNKVCKLLIETGRKSVEVRNLLVSDTFTGPFWSTDGRRLLFSHSYLTDGVNRYSTVVLSL